MDQNELRGWASAVEKPQTKLCCVGKTRYHFAFHMLLTSELHAPHTHARAPANHTKINGKLPSICTRSHTSILPLHLHLLPIASILLEFDCYCKDEWLANVFCAPIRYTAFFFFYFYTSFPLLVLSFRFYHSLFAFLLYFLRFFFLAAAAGSDWLVRCTRVGQRACRACRGNSFFSSFFHLLEFLYFAPLSFVTEKCEYSVLTHHIEYRKWPSFYHTEIHSAISFRAFGVRSSLCCFCCCYCCRSFSLSALSRLLLPAHRPPLVSASARTRASRNKFIVYFRHCNHSLPIKLPVPSLRAAVKVKVLVKMWETLRVRQAGESMAVGYGHHCITIKTRTKGKRHTTEDEW